MPYRRLPSTDLSRIAALRKAVVNEGVRYHDQLVLSYRTIQDARQMLSKLEKAQTLYQQAYDTQIKVGKSFKIETKTAHMYVSHFVQVLNMCIERGEIKKDVKRLYGLDPNSNVIPDLSKEQNLQEWGEKIIKGEEERCKNGGFPIYNPSIAKVKVHYNIFSDHLYNQNELRKTTQRYLDAVTGLRPIVDDIILDMWNQVELTFSDLPMEAKIERCRAFGVIYYFRTSEKNKMEAEKRQGNLLF